VKGATKEFQNRAHFVAIAAIAVRRLLVERARAQLRQTRWNQVQVTRDNLLSDTSRNDGHWISSR
jgi:hypothetical protein